MSRAQRRLFQEEEQSAEPGRFGCPMLERAHCGPLRGRATPVYRCSLGWALRGEDDVMRCRDVDAVPDCWKLHPERVPAVAEIEESEAVIGVPVLVPGD